MLGYPHCTHTSYMNVSMYLKILGYIFYRDIDGLYSMKCEEQHSSRSINPCKFLAITKAKYFGSFRDKWNVSVQQYEIKMEWLIEQG